MMWQPMPAPTIAPSGAFRLLLCGQPLQKYGVRVVLSSTAPRAGACRRCSRACAGAWPASWVASRRPSARAITSGDSSPCSGSSGAPLSSALPTMRGREPSGAA